VTELLRRGHFLGAKLRSVRKRNGLTLEELSVRCIQRNSAFAPSVSYLSMIESGKRTPSGRLLELLAAVFQRAPAWFLDESADLELPAPAPGGAAAGGDTGAARPDRHQRAAVRAPSHPLTPGDVPQ
jgi:transcriptional regulator with XRE-family HTH domain